MTIAHADPYLVAPAGPVDATVALPGSKSITNRALVCAALALGRSELIGTLQSDDTEAMMRLLRGLGVPVLRGPDDEVLVGSGGIRTRNVSLDARQSGTTARFILPVLALDATRRHLDGDHQLRQRPMGPTFDVLRGLGAKVGDDASPGHLPVYVQGPIRGGVARVRGDLSSQFLSGLLLAAPLVRYGLTIECTSELVSRPYVDMTVAVMRAFKGKVHQSGDRWEVVGHGYEGCRYVVEPDASAASYAFAAAVLTGGAVTVPGLHRGALQGDVGFVDVLERMGARVRWDADAVTVAAGDELRGVDVDMSQISDTAQTLAVVATAATSPTRLRNIGFIRNKETDRLAATVAELRRLGIEATETDDGMLIEPGEVRPATIETYRDHRMAMSFGVLGLVNEGVAIADPGCVAKTFPGFWDLLDRLRDGSVPPARAF